MKIKADKCSRCESTKNLLMVKIKKVRPYVICEECYYTIPEEPATTPATEEVVGE